MEWILEKRILVQRRKIKPNPLCFRQIIFRNCILAAFFYFYFFFWVVKNLTFHIECTWRSGERLKWVLFNWSVTGKIYIPLDFSWWSWFGDTATTTTQRRWQSCWLAVQSIRVQFRNEIALLAGIAPTARKSQIRLNFTNRCNQTFKTNISLSNKQQ